MAATYISVLLKDQLKKTFAFPCCLGTVICSTVCAEDDDISQCASSAADGYQVWSDLTCLQRANVLQRYW